MISLGYYMCVDKCEVSREYFQTESESRKCKLKFENSGLSKYLRFSEDARGVKHYNRVILPELFYNFFFYNRLRNPKPTDLPYYSHAGNISEMVVIRE